MYKVEMEIIYDSIQLESDVFTCKNEFQNILIYQLTLIQQLFETILENIIINVS